MKLKIHICQIRDNNQIYQRRDIIDCQRIDKKSLVRMVNIFYMELCQIGGDD